MPGLIERLRRIGGLSKQVKPESAEPTHELFEPEPRAAETRPEPAPMPDHVNVGDTVRFATTVDLDFRQVPVTGSGLVNGLAYVSEIYYLINVHWSLSNRRPPNRLEIKWSDATEIIPK